MESKWLRAKTTRRYIHGPKAERMFTIWAEGKIVFGEVEGGFDPSAYWRDVFSSLIWFVHGKENEQFDFKKCVNVVREDGIPVQGLKHSFSGIDVNIEAISNICRKPTCFIKVTLTNTTENTLSDTFGFLLKSGPENKLVFGSPDVYKSYNPDIKELDEFSNTWENVNGVLKDSEKFVNVNSELDFVFDTEKGIAKFDFELNAGQSKEILLSFGKGEAFAFDYNEEKEKTIAFWQGELAKITNLPANIVNDTEKYNLIKTLTVQILQSFSYFVNGEDLVLRQGGLQRRIWQGEAVYALKALSILGDFGEYVEPVLSFYFDVLQNEEGEIIPQGEPWANITSSSLASLLDYCCVNPAYYEKRKENAYKAFKWIKNTRTKGGEVEGEVKGLFPALRGTDSGMVFQNWGFTDTKNLVALKTYKEFAKEYDKENYAEIAAEYDDYIFFAKKYFKEYADSIEGDEMRLPLTPLGNPEHLLEKFTFEGLTFGLINIVSDSEEDLERVINFYSRRGRYADPHGIYSIRLNTFDGSEPHVWYTSCNEYSMYWFYMRHGKREEALKQIESKLKFCITDEKYMIERYRDDDEYYAPWSPNVSANGRLIEMLIDYYK